MNGGSGHHDSERTRATLSAIFTEAGREHAFFLLENPAELARQAGNAVEAAHARGGVVVAAGGDGTLNAVAQAVLGSGCTFGVLPQGTFNLFGRVHGIPQDTAAQARALLSGHVEHVQVGLMNGRAFLVNASVGLYPQVLEDRETFKDRFGRSRSVAVAAGLVTLARHRELLELDVETDGREYSLRTPTLFVGNNRLQLERIGIAAASRLDDGTLAGIVVRPISTCAMFGLALRGALGTLGDAENVHGFSFRKLVVQPRGKRRIKVSTDGEVQRVKTPLVFEVAPHALPLLVPAAEQQAAVA